MRSNNHNKASKRRQQVKRKTNMKSRVRTKGGMTGLNIMFDGADYGSPIFQPQRKKFKGIDKENKRLGRGRWKK